MKIIDIHMYWYDWDRKRNRSKWTPIECCVMRAATVELKREAELKRTEAIDAKWVQAERRGARATEWREVNAFAEWVRSSQRTQTQIADVLSGHHMQTDQWFLWKQSCCIPIENSRHESMFNRCPHRDRSMNDVRIMSGNHVL